MEADDLLCSRGFRSCPIIGHRFVALTVRCFPIPVRPISRRLFSPAQSSVLDTQSFPVAISPYPPLSPRYSVLPRGTQHFPRVRDFPRGKGYSAAY